MEQSMGTLTEGKKLREAQTLWRLRRGGIAGESLELGCSIFSIFLLHCNQYSLTKSGHPGGMASKVGERSGLPKVIWSDNC